MATTVYNLRSVVGGCRGDLRHSRVRLPFLFRLTDLVATASQISFYSSTGSEIRWDAARSVGASRQGMKLILSGMATMVAAATVIGIASWLSAQGIWNVMSRWLCALLNIRGDTKTPLEQQSGPSDLRSLYYNRSRFWTLIGCGVTFGLWIVRPAIPFNHMTGALPFVMLGEGSRARRINVDSFPLPELLAPEFHEPANGHYKGWAPVMSDDANRGYGNNKPAWAQGPLPLAFERWIVNPEANMTGVTDKSRTQLSQRGDRGHSNKTMGPREYFYNPSQDPMRISNLDLDPLDPLQEALKDHAIPINHIVFVFLESGRKDLFPLKTDSHLYEQIRETHDIHSDEDLDDLHDKLSLITPFAEILTGEESGFGQSKGVDTERGGISFNGILSGSSLSAKSRLVNYCGLGPLPVDFMHENDIIPYQPCLMHILDLFNQRKNATSRSGNSTNDPREREWQTLYAQSVTGEFQDQTELMDLLGFNQSLYSEDIDPTTAKYYHEDMEKINYFGYAETEVSPYIKDMINETLSQNKRLFLSHFTSTTHHPWGTPEGYRREKYFGDKHHSQHEAMDDFLNANSFVDAWLEELMGMLADAGIANETLTVFVGDHGQAFREDSPVTGTYQNPHISNFRVPLLFHHPLLPRLHINVNGSAMSILPTILDLLITTSSLNELDTTIAQDLINEYEGQSLIRPYRTSHNGREAWNMGVINAGGTMLSVGSAAVPWRLNLPLNNDFEYRFTDLEKDPLELHPATAWSMGGLTAEVYSKFGAEAVDWVIKAEKVGLWWVTERKKLWNYEDEEEE
ncbi:uncharacterized protein N7511_005656 [Penicillium nucicola]|uniref:uncharacterized protein n=1 Tax=Penicillium nucicola TaxID=1850975 RepID=UPI002545AC84|nr:uncharacterized protein N7511_005656 [Penicillium nucicola]KAJ5762274.1 hypothetical protein N7511_005656 [Penicillium nucicola]